VGSILLKPAHLTSTADWSATIATNLTSAFGCVRAAGRLLKAEGGSVVLVSSAAARVGLANHEAIAAAKAGIMGLVLSAAATYARQKIRFNAVAPGLVRTPLAAGLVASELAEKASIGMHPLGRLGEPGDVARAIVWLLDPAQSWVTAQVIGVDGGLADVKR
jgi:NAD(P)-dependent dehydrogenase (short-subunit alcohol dehydrogenase family)